MARQIQDRDLSPILAAAERWIHTCLIADRSMFVEDARWTAALASEVHRSFVEHPDLGDDDFMTKLKGQMKSATPAAKQLTAEMLWALFLFPSNIGSRTKRLHVFEIWSLSGQSVAPQHS